MQKMMSMPEGLHMGELRQMISIPLHGSPSLMKIQKSRRLLAYTSVLEKNLIPRYLTLGRYLF